MSNLFVQKIIFIVEEKKDPKTIYPFNLEKLKHFVYFFHSFLIRKVLVPSLQIKSDVNHLEKYQRKYLFFQHHF